MERTKKWKRQYKHLRTNKKKPLIYEKPMIKEEGDVALMVSDCGVRAWGGCENS